MKVDNPDLIKTVKTISGLLAKSASFHAKKAGLHKAIAAAHKARAATIKAHADGLGDDHEMKAYFAHKAAFHETKAQHHEEMASSHEEQAGNEKSIIDQLKVEEPTTQKTTPSDPPATPAAPEKPGDGIAKMIDDTTQSVVKKALETLDSDPKVAERIQEIVLQKVNEALGSKLEPTAIKTVIPPGTPAVTAVPRTGANLAKLADDVAPELRDLVSVNDIDG